MAASMVGSAMGQTRPGKQSGERGRRQADVSKGVSVAESVAGSAMGHVRQVSGQGGQCEQSS